jgi:hypothetical protein
VKAAQRLPQAASHWDLGWVRRLKGKYRAVFDVPELEDGFGVWRAVIWRKQYAQIFGVPEEYLSRDPIGRRRYDKVPAAHARLLYALRENQLGLLRQ